MDYGVIECLGMDGAYVLDILEDSAVYVSGPKDTTDEAYAEAAAWLRSHGAARATTPNLLVDAPLAPYQLMRERFHELTCRRVGERPWYDLVVALEGWRVSEVCRLEMEVAYASGIEVISLNRLKLKHAREHERLGEFLKSFGD